VSDEIQPPHPNGAMSHPSPRRAHAPWEFIILALLVALLGVGIILAWTLVGSHSPERLDAESAGSVNDACAAAQASLRALPNPSPVTGADRVTRIHAEDEILRAMLLRMHDVHPRSATPARALEGWTGDWSRVIDARERYASDLEQTRTTGGRTQFVLPASTSGSVKPVTSTMDDFVRENHPRIDACFTDALALSTVEGTREYKKVTR
jgi:hypothetical protein